jgi:hypothetical protein
VEASSDGSLTGCDGCTGQWCSRHSMPKGKTHRRLCATNPKYFDLWEHGKRPVVQYSGTSTTTGERIKRQREHWAKLHTTLMDSAMFAEWVDAIPGCATCKRDFLELIKINPPRFDDWWKWGWEIHNAVNRKLGKPELTWDYFQVIWGPYTQGVL